MKKQPRPQPRLRPSNQLLKAVELYGGTYGAARAWQIGDVSLRRWLAGQGGICDSTMLAIERGSGLSHEQAFIIKTA